LSIPGKTSIAFAGDPTEITTAARAAAIKTPGFGDRRKAMLQDIAILTGSHRRPGKMGGVR
jgi:chaperonin GroEL (HSP60 family)